MAETLIVFRRELRSYFLSPIAYVFGVLFLALQLGWTTDLMVVHGAQASMQWFFLMLPFVFLLFVPALTMRLWAEERKLGTIELLLTFPVRLWHVVLGKFVAVQVFLAFVLLLTMGVPLTLGTYGQLDWPPVLGAYLASLLFAGSYVAVGMFWSSLTKDQLVALLSGLVSLYLLYKLGSPVWIESIAAWLPSWGVDLLNGLSPYKYFESIARGVLDSRDLVYFTLFCAFFLHLNVLVLALRRSNKG